MAEPQVLSDIVEEGGASSDLANSPVHEQSPVREQSPHHLQHVKPRNNSVSHVDVDYFDQSGALALLRTLTEKSQKSVKQSKLNRTSSSISSSTAVSITPGDGPYDLEKALRDIIKR